MGFSKNFEKRLMFHFGNDRSDGPVLTFKKRPKAQAKRRTFRETNQAFPNLFVSSVYEKFDVSLS